jgi:hypothetical protein
MQIGQGDFALTMAELRIVARYAVESAQEALPIFEKAVPGDRRPRAGWIPSTNGAHPAHRDRLLTRRSMTSETTRRNTPLAVHTPRRCRPQVP